ncbi:MULTISPECIES: DUF6568 family protein [unclassified Gemella]|uniref:conjugal transfer protein TraF n=1 Tax=unclassified Gemella TaxID=2624949 RepID=UPI001C54DA5B|nr:MULTISPECIES: DUF6568 family protein [unclassified Gemella]
MQTFEENIKNFLKIISDDAQNKLSTEEGAIVFVGRSSCPFCRKFAPKLKNVVDQLEKNVYFVDSENVFDNNLVSFREKYNIKTVPALLILKNNEVKVVMDSSLSEKEIENFILA